MKGHKYLNFPIHLLRDAPGDIRQTMSNIMAYAGYVHTLNLEYGSNEAKMKAAGEFFGITYGSAAGSYANGERLYDEAPERIPFTGITKQMCFEFYKHEKTEREVVTLLAFLAVKSILGNKLFACITNAFLLSRMAGYGRVTPEIPEAVAAYNTRRKLDRIKHELRENWGVNIYGYRMKGFYVSIEEKLPYKQLVFEAEKRRKNNKLASLKKQQDEAREQALSKLNNEQNANR
jgi:hypothetical protein